MNSHNFIPTQRLMAKRQQRAIGRWLVIDVGFLVILILLGVFYLVYSVEQSDHSIQPLASGQIQTSAAALAEMQQEAQSLKAQLQSVSDVYAQPDWSILLRALSQQLGDNIVLTGVDSIEAAADRSSTDSSPTVFQIQGIGRSQQAVTQFVLRLEDLNFFSRVKVDQVTSRSFHGRDGTGFVIHCSVPASSERNP